MTKSQATKACKDGSRVCAGEPGTGDYDEGHIVSVGARGSAFVAWDSGVRTHCPLALLALLHQ